MLENLELYSFHINHVPLGLELTYLIEVHILTIHD